jgi:hypothetical protein
MSTELPLGVFSVFDLKTWLRESCSGYVFRPKGLFQETGLTPHFPVTAHNPAELTQALRAGGHLLPLPSESAALANVLETGIVGHLMEAATGIAGLETEKGGTRSYPDLEMTGDLLDGRYWAVEVKAARRAQLKRQEPTTTQSRISLYTGNTFFQWPKMEFSTIKRPFGEYAGHLDLILIYTLDEPVPEKVRDLEIFVHEPWRIASRQRSSDTREYIGAVMHLDKLRDGVGEFETEAEFYKYWRAFNWKMSATVKKKLLAQQVDD